jgi:hypothetical protein
VESWGGFEDLACGFEEEVICSDEDGNSDGAGERMYERHW